MSCCKAKKYNWCNNEPVAYKDEQGNEYCAFHAPQGKKGYELSQFNSAIYKRINEDRGGDCNLSGTIFEGDIELNLSRLVGIQLSEAVFSGNARFNNAVSSGQALFNNVQFKGDALFQHCIFPNHTNFHSAHFYEGAYFGWANFNGLTWFHQTTFDKVAAFDNAKINGDMECVWTVFKGRANFLRTAFNKKIRFDGCIFHEEASFLQAEFNDKAFFTKKFVDDLGTFSGFCLFSNVTMTGKVRFEGINCKKISFMDTDLKQIDFVNCVWDRIRGRNVLYDERNLLNKSDQGLASDIKKVEILYRKLKQKYKEEHDEQEASNWHYGEKEMFRKRNKLRRYLPSLSTIYWLTSGYGERPIRAAIVLLSLIVSASIASLFAGLSFAAGTAEIYGIENQHIQAGPTVKMALATLMNTLKYLTFQKDIFFLPTGWLGESIKLAAQILVPVQAALFAFAVRNRFRR